MRHRAGLLTVLAIPALLVSGCQASTRSTMAAATAPPNTPASTVNGLALVNDSARRISNGRLAFQLEAPAGDHTQTDIYTVKPNGSDLTALTSTPDENEFGPAWDAAGARIAFWRTSVPSGWCNLDDGCRRQPSTTAHDRARRPGSGLEPRRYENCLHPRRCDRLPHLEYARLGRAAIAGRSRRAQPRTSSPPGPRMAPGSPSHAASNRATRVTSASSTSPPDGDRPRRFGRVRPPGRMVPRRRQACLRAGLRKPVLDLHGDAGRVTADPADHRTILRCRPDLLARRTIHRVRQRPRGNVPRRPLEHHGGWPATSPDRRSPLQRGLPRLATGAIADVRRSARQSHRPPPALSDGAAKRRVHAKGDRDACPQGAYRQPESLISVASARPASTSWTGPRPPDGGAAQRGTETACSSASQAQSCRAIGTTKRTNRIVKLASEAAAALIEPHLKTDPVSPGGF